MKTAHASSEPWDEAIVREAIEKICADALAHFDRERLWNVHPSDEWARDGDTTLYWGATAVIWALDRLRREGAIGSGGNFAEMLPLLLDRNRTGFAQMIPYLGMDTSQASFLVGDVGVLLLWMRLAPDAETADALHARISANLALPALELMWGIPGTMLACKFAHEMTGERRWRQLFLLQAEKLLAELEETPEGPMWTQELYLSRFRFLGLVHGLAGNMLALLSGFEWLDGSRQESIRDAISRTLTATAVHGVDGVNWRADGLVTSEPRLVQICHGAPGMIVAFADERVSTPELRALLCEAGDLVWHTGPLAKGSNLCHGTAGNGYALLKLHALTQDGIWLERARHFAMSAIARWRETQAQHGSGRYSLWTGDAGLAAYLWDCISGEPHFPTLDVF